MTTVSVVIPTYNRRDYLLACLDSVVAQRRAPNEVIVVDDGSTDGTVDALAQRADVTLIRQANAGAGAARNRGARAATGDYIAFLDSDDLWFPWSLEAMMTLVERHRPTLLFARYEDFSHAPIATEAVPQSEVFTDYLACAGRDHYAGAGMMVVERMTFLAAGGFAEDRLNAEDHDLALRLGTALGFVQTLAPVTVAHRLHEGNAMGDEAANVAGLVRLISNERARRYPGGTRRQAARRTIVAARARPAILSAARAGQPGLAFALYRDTFGWNLTARRGAFLAYAAALILTALVGPARRPVPEGGLSTP